MKRFLTASLCAATAFICCLVAAYMFFEYSSDALDVGPEELAGVGSPYKIYYEKLDDDEKRAYNKILSEIYSIPESIEIPPLDAEKLDEAFMALLYDNPDLFFVGRRCSTTTRLFKSYCSIEYIMDKKEYAECRAKLEKAIEKAVSSFTASGDEWQTELEIHDYIIDFCEYELAEDDPVRSSCYGALVNGRAACEGYAKATKALLDAAGIKNAVLSGVSKNFDGERGPHMWNAVEINGNYYHLDCTWDDPIGENDERKPRIYSYFNLNDEAISKTHSDFSYDFHCDSTTENYHVKTGKYFETYDESREEKLAELIAGELKNGGSSVQLRFGDKKAYNAAVKSLLSDGKIYEVLRLAKRKSPKSFSDDAITYYKDPDRLTLVLIPKKK